MLSLLPYLIFFLLIVVAGFAIGIFKYRRAKYNIINDGAKYLKKNGEKIVVNLLACEILHREYYEKNEIGTEILKDISVLTYTTSTTDKTKIVFKSLQIHLSKEKLKDRLEDEKETIIYVDPSNNENYYFDLEFIIEFII